MKKFFSIVFTLVFTLGLFAQKMADDKGLKPQITFSQINHKGASSVSLAWLDNLKIYAAAVSTDSTSWFDFFDKSGKYINSLPANARVGGIWYNDAQKVLQASTLGDYSVLSYKVFMQKDTLAPNKFTYAEVSLNLEEIYVSNVALSFDTSEQLLYSVEFNDESGMNLFALDFYDLEYGAGSFSQLGELPVGISKLNQKTAVYTGRKGFEYGLYNYGDRVVYFYPNDIGQEDYTKLAKTIILDAEAPAVKEFGVAYTNNLFWLFDKAKGTWLGYKINFEAK